MTDKFKGVDFQGEGDLFNPKKINLPYTLFIIKPETCLNFNLCQEIIAQLEEKGFEIRFVLQRELTKQEASNLYYKHESKDYFTRLVAYNTTGESLVMLLSHKTDDPISALRTVVGPKEPDKAKLSNPACLRAKYGKDVVRNEFYLSDDADGANKDRDVFRFPIPQKIPDFVLDRYKVSLPMLWKFLHPKNLEHSNVRAKCNSDKRQIRCFRFVRPCAEPAPDKQVLKAGSAYNKELYPVVQTGSDREGTRTIGDQREERGAGQSNQELSDFDQN